MGVDIYIYVYICISCVRVYMCGERYLFCALMGTHSLCRWVFILCVDGSSVFVSMGLHFSNRRIFICFALTCCCADGSSFCASMGLHFCVDGSSFLCRLVFLVRRIVFIFCVDWSSFFASMDLRFVCRWVCNLHIPNRIV